MRKYIFSTLLLGLTFTLGFVTHITSVHARTDSIRVGIIGDSNSDEYRADDNRAGGTSYEATTLSWVELLAKYKGIDFGTWGRWGGERRTGYEYNWARSAATSESMIANGQHTGLAAQIKAGKIDYAIIFIGANDFHSWNGTYEKVYNGKLSDQQLQAKIDGIVANITLAVDTLQAAGNVKIILTNYADPNASADFISHYTDKNKRQRVSDAIIEIDKRLAELASDRGLILADLYNFGSSVLSRIDSKGNIIVGGEAISAVVHGDEPHHLQLESGVGHLGTVGSGLLANFFLTAFSSDNVSIPQFTDEELLANAGINTSASSTNALSQGADALKSIIHSLLGQ